MDAARISAAENRELARMMLQETWTEKREREDVHRGMDDQPWMAVFMDIATFRVIWVAPDGSHNSQTLAATEVGWWQDKARRGGLIISPMSYNVRPENFLLRQQGDLDHLIAEIRGG